MVAKLPYRLSTYDYRAVTAGVLFLLMAAVMFSSIPTTTIACDAEQGGCLVTHKTIRHSQVIRVDFPRILKAKRDCVPSGSQCDWTVRLVVKGGDVPVFEAVKEEGDAERMVAGINGVLKHDTATFTDSRPGDRTWCIIFGAIGIALVVMGIRRNMQDKGML